MSDVGYVLPISSIRKRLTDARDQLRNDIVACHFWQFRRKWLLQGGAAAYNVEIKALEMLEGDPSGLTSTPPIK